MATFKSKIGRHLIPLLPVNRRTFNILRHELSAIRLRIVNALDPRYHVVVWKLRKRKNLQLNIATGGKGLPGWVNTEIRRHADTTLCLDVRKNLPLASDSVARILAEHVVEHVDFQYDLPSMLSDWHRVLKPGGVLRIVVPDLQSHIEAYVSKDPSRWKALGWDLANMPWDVHTPMHILNHTFHQGGEHLFGYDFETLKWALDKAGFASVRRSAFGQSVDPLLAIDQANHAPYSLYVDAVR